MQKIERLLKTLKLCQCKTHSVFKLSNFSLFRIVKEQIFHSPPLPVHSEISLGSQYLYGGAKRDRTADLLRARQALSQLSYSPIKNNTPYLFLLIDMNTNDDQFA